MATWTIDNNHSEVGFKVRHLVISTVSGSFKKFEGGLRSEKDDFSDADVWFTAETDSVDTGNEQRDGHLKSPDFFDAANFPKIEFKSSKITKKGESEYLLEGVLTIRGNSHPVKLNVEFGGIQQDFYGNTVAGFDISGKISRKEFGLQWHAVTETGGVVVGDEVKLHMSIELIKKVAEPVSA